MDEFLQSIAKGIKERLGSAFLFNFLLSWVVFNWEFVYITLFVNENNLVPFNKFDTLQDTVFVIWPAIISALLISLISPVINSLVKTFKHLIIKLYDWLENLIDGKVPYTDKQFADLKRKHSNLTATYNKAITEAESDKKRIADLFEEKENYVTKFNDSINDIKKKDDELIKKENELSKIKEELHQSFESFEVKNETIKKLELNIQKLQSFGFYYNSDALVEFEIKCKLKDGDDIKQLAKEAERMPNLGIATINLPERKLSLLSDIYRLTKYYNTEMITSISGLLKQNTEILFTFKQIYSGCVTLSIYNTKLDTTENYLLVQIIKF
jgi:hypothetical protein